MAAPTPPQPPPTSTPSSQPSSSPSKSQPLYPANGTPAWLHNAAIAACILTPIGLLLPPRRMDLRATILTSGFFFGSSQLAHDYTGRSLHGRFADRFASLTSSDLPDKAQETQRRMADERARRAVAAGTATQEQIARVEVLRRAREEGRLVEREEEPKGLLKKVWMGGQGEDWVEKRAEEEARALREGKGYYGLIAEQVAEVFGRGKKEEGKKDGDEKKKE